MNKVSVRLVHSSQDACVGAREAIVFSVCSSREWTSLKTWVSRQTAGPIPITTFDKDCVGYQAFHIRTAPSSHARPASKRCQDL